MTSPDIPTCQSEEPTINEMVEAREGSSEGREWASALAAQRAIINTGLSWFDDLRSPCDHHDDPRTSRYLEP